MYFCLLNLLAFGYHVTILRKMTSKRIKTTIEGFYNVLAPAKNGFFLNCINAMRNGFVFNSEKYRRYYTHTGIAKKVKFCQAVLLFLICTKFIIAQNLKNYTSHLFLLLELCDKDLF